jgi:hypothetical protein
MDNSLRQNFFRAGNAHAGVIVILPLVCQIFADSAVLPSSLVWLVRIGVPRGDPYIGRVLFLDAAPAATAPSGKTFLYRIITFSPAGSSSSPALTPRAAGTPKRRKAWVMTSRRPKTIGPLPTKS